MWRARAGPDTTTRHPQALPSAARGAERDRELYREFGLASRSRGRGCLAAHRIVTVVDYDTNASPPQPQDHNTGRAQSENRPTPAKFKHSPHTRRTCPPSSIRSGGGEGRGAQSDYTYLGAHHRHRVHARHSTHSRTYKLSGERSRAGGGSPKVAPTFAPGQTATVNISQDCVANLDASIQATP